MPPNYEYLICACNRQSTSVASLGGFEAVFRINLSSKEEFLKWKDDFQESSLSTLDMKCQEERVAYNVIFI